MSVNVKEMLYNCGLSPKKHLGQNFLIDKNIIKKIIDTADIKNTDNVLEVGPGLGILTFELIQKAKKVLAVEKDQQMVEALKTLVSKSASPSVLESKKLEIACNDILDFGEEKIKKFFNKEKYKVIANLPYNITSRFLKTFLEFECQPLEMILMIQQEVGQRIVEKPGRMSMLAISVQFFAEPKIEFVVRSGCFYPAPKVDSVVVSLKNIKKNKYKINADKFFQIVKIGFSQKRKQLKSVLLSQKNMLNIDLSRLQSAFQELGFSPTVRAQELSVLDWVNLVKKLGKLTP